MVVRKRKPKYDDLSWGNVQTSDKNHRHKGFDSNKCYLTDQVTGHNNVHFLFAWIYSISKCGTYGCARNGSVG